MLAINVWGNAMLRGMSVEFHNTFGKRVKLLRDYLDLSQDEVRDEVIRRGGSLGQSYLSELENSHKIPGGAIVAALADILGTTADYLLLRTDIPYPKNEEHAQTYITPEAEQVALIVDEIRSERRRREILRMAEGMLGEDEASRMVDVIGNNERELRSFLIRQQSKRSPEDFKSLLDDWKQLFDDLDQTGNE